MIQDHTYRDCARSPGSYPSLSVTVLIGITSGVTFDPAPVGRVRIQRRHGAHIMLELACNVRRKSAAGQGQVRVASGRGGCRPACPRGRPYDGIMHSGAIDVDSYLAQVPGGGARS